MFGSFPSLRASVLSPSAPPTRLCCRRLRRSACAGSQQRVCCDGVHTRPPAQQAWVPSRHSLPFKPPSCPTGDKDTSPQKGSLVFAAAPGTPVHRGWRCDKALLALCPTRRHKTVVAAASPERKNMREPSQDLLILGAPERRFFPTVGLAEIPGSATAQSSLTPPLSWLAGWLARAPPAA